MSIYSPYILPFSNARQKLSLVEFNNYTSAIDMYLGNPSKIETL